MNETNKRNMDLHFILPQWLRHVPITILVEITEHVAEIDRKIYIL